MSLSGAHVGLNGHARRPAMPRRGRVGATQGTRAAAHWTPSKDKGHKMV